MSLIPRDPTLPECVSGLCDSRFQHRAQHEIVLTCGCTVNYCAKALVEAVKRLRHRCPSCGAPGRQIKGHKPLNTSCDHLCPPYSKHRKR